MKKLTKERKPQIKSIEFLIAKTLADKSRADLHLLEAVNASLKHVAYEDSIKHNAYKTLLTEIYINNYHAKYSVFGLPSEFNLDIKTINEARRNFLQLFMMIYLGTEMVEKNYLFKIKDFMMKDFYPPAEKPKPPTQPNKNP